VTLDRDVLDRFGQGQAERSAEIPRITSRRTGLTSLSRVDDALVVTRLSQHDNRSLFRVAHTSETLLRRRGIR
jgi:hypothetical protein